MSEDMELFRAEAAITSLSNKTVLKILESVQKNSDGADAFSKVAHNIIERY